MEKSIYQVPKILRQQKHFFRVVDDMKRGGEQNKCRWPLDFSNKNETGKSLQLRKKNCDSILFGKPNQLGYQTAYSSYNRLLTKKYRLYSSASPSKIFPMIHSRFLTYFRQTKQTRHVACSLFQSKR